ncbi:DUF6233 domain-containing protein [Actinacidiphila glaucinigra]|uniref:DUF6233 domain-containing protein n=1 Tax=Actinacidiphila glaucinigra TaxID=235986 RepID=UPI00325565F4
MTDQQRDARPCPPWVSGPQPRLRSYAPTERPRLRIRVDGAWRSATVRQRQDWPQGVAYQVDIALPDPDLGYDVPVIRTYWWDPDTMRAPGQRPRPAATGWQLRHMPGTGGAVLHRDDCPQAGGGHLDKASALIALREPNIECCPQCRPERDLQ